MRRIMYVENKCGGLSGNGRIGWVEMSRTARSYTYRRRRLLKTGSGYKFNCVDEENGDEYWVSGPHRNGADMLYGGTVQIDDDARVEYWTRIRMQPSRAAESSYSAGASTRSAGRYRRNERRMRGT